MIFWTGWYSINRKKSWRISIRLTKDMFYGAVKRWKCSKNRSEYTSFKGRKFDMINFNCDDFLICELPVVPARHFEQLLKSQYSS